MCFSSLLLAITFPPAVCTSFPPSPCSCLFVSCCFLAAGVCRRLSKEELETFDIFPSFVIEKVSALTHVNEVLGNKKIGFEFLPFTPRQPVCFIKNLHKIVTFDVKPGKGKEKCEGLDSLFTAKHLVNDHVKSKECTLK